MTVHPTAALTVAAALTDATTRLAAAGADTPRLDAEVLLAFALGQDRTWLFLHPDAPAAPSYEELVARRAKREPVAYIVGTKPFRRIELQVDPRVLIPRDATETLVQLAIDELAHGARVVDVGTGSGAIALALADERPDLELLAVDASADALTVARANAARLNARIRFAHSDLLAAVTEPLDAIVANLPYVETDAQLQPEITDYEPAQALFAGADGLDAYRALLADTRAVSWIALEHGDGQQDALVELVGRAGFTRVRSERELGGVARVVVGER